MLKSPKASLPSEIQIDTGSNLQVNSQLEPAPDPNVQQQYTQYLNPFYKKQSEDERLFRWNQFQKFWPGVDQLYQESQQLRTAIDRWCLVIGKYIQTGTHIPSAAQGAAGLLQASRPGSKYMIEYHRLVVQMYTFEAIQKTVDTDNSLQGMEKKSRVVKKYPEHLTALCKILNVQPWIVESAICHQGPENGLTTQALAMVVWLWQQTVQMEHARIESVYQKLDADKNRDWTNYTKIWREDLNVQRAMYEEARVTMDKRIQNWIDIYTDPSADKPVTELHRETRLNLLMTLHEWILMREQQIAQQDEDEDDEDHKVTKAISEVMRQEMLTQKMDEAIANGWTIKRLINECYDKVTIICIYCQQAVEEIHMQAHPGLCIQQVKKKEKKEQKKLFDLQKAMKVTKEEQDKRRANAIANETKILSGDVMVPAHQKMEWDRLRQVMIDNQNKSKNNTVKHKMFQEEKQVGVFIQNIRSGFRTPDQKADVYMRLHEMNRKHDGKLTIAMLQETHTSTDPHFSNMKVSMSRGSWSNDPNEKGGVATILMGRYYGTRLVIPQQEQVFYDTIVMTRYLFENVMVTCVNVYFPPKATKEFRRKILQQLEYVETQCDKQKTPQVLIVGGDFNKHGIATFPQIAKDMGMKNIIPLHQTTRRGLNNKGQYVEAHLDNAWYKVYEHEAAITSVTLDYDKEFSDHSGIYFEIKFKSHSDKVYDVMITEPMGQKMLRDYLSKRPQIDKVMKWSGLDAFSTQLPVDKLTKTRSINLMDIVPSYYAADSSALLLDVEQKLRSTHEQSESLFRLWKNAGGVPVTKWWTRMKSIMKIETNSNQIQGLRLPSDHIITNTEKINEHLAPVLRDLYTAKAGEPPVTFNPHQPPLHPVFTHAQVTEGLTQVNMSKAIGPDLFDFQAIKEGCTEEEWAVIMTTTVTWVYGWLNVASDFPDWVKQARAVPLPKGGKNIVTSDEIRFLSMTTMHCRVIEKTMVAKFHEIGIWSTGEYQTGFKAGEACSTHQVNFLSFIRRHMIEKDDGSMILAIDFQKAFDSVNRNKLYEFMEQKINALPASNRNRVEATHWLHLYKKLNDNWHIKLGKESILQTKGLPQGSILSPVIFNFYLEEVIKKSERLTVMSKVGDLKAYADDIGLACKNWGVVRAVIKEFERMSEFGLIINKKKCEILVKKLPSLAQDGSIDSEDEGTDEYGTPKYTKAPKRTGIPRKENQTIFDGVAVVTKMRYLGVIFSASTEQMVNTAVNKCKKYTVFFEKRCNLGEPAKGVNGQVSKHDRVLLEKMRVQIINSYAKSLIRFHIFPIYATGLMSLEQLKKVVGTVTKQASQLSKDLSSSTVFNVFDSINQDNIVNDIVLKTRQLQAAGKAGTNFLSIQSAREISSIDAIVATMTNEESKKQARAMYLKYGKRWENVKLFISLLDRGRIEGNYGTTHVCTICKEAVNFNHMTTCAANVLGPTSVENAIKCKNIATHPVVQIFMNSEFDQIHTLEFYERLKVNVEALIQSGVYTKLTDGFTTVDHLKAMRQEADIKKQSMRDHRSALSRAAKDQQRLNAVARELKEIFNTATRVLVNPHIGAAQKEKIKFVARNFKKHEKTMELINDRLRSSNGNDGSWDVTTLQADVKFDKKAFGGNQWVAKTLELGNAPTVTQMQAREEEKKQEEKKQNRRVKKLVKSTMEVDEEGFTKVQMEDVMEQINQQQIAEHMRPADERKKLAKKNRLETIWVKGVERNRITGEEVKPPDEAEDEEDLVDNTPINIDAIAELLENQSKPKKQKSKTLKQLAREKLQDEYEFLDQFKKQQKANSPIDVDADNAVPESPMVDLEESKEHPGQPITDSERHTRRQAHRMAQQVLQTTGSRRTFSKTPKKISMNPPAENTDQQTPSPVKKYSINEEPLHLNRTPLQVTPVKSSYLTRTVNFVSNVVSSTSKYIQGSPESDQGDHMYTNHDYEYDNDYAHSPSDEGS